MDVYIKMLQDWIVVPPSSKVYTVSTVLFHKYVGANVTAKNCMSHVSMFSPTKATMKLDNGNTGHAQWIGIILCHFHNYTIIYMAGTVYHCTGYPSNTISLGALKFYVDSQKVTS